VVSRNNFLVMFSLSLSPPFMHIPLLGVVSFGQGFYDYCNVYWGGGGGDVQQIEKGLRTEFKPLIVTES
jgi:hypothetical protein